MTNDLHPKFYYNHHCVKTFFQVHDTLNVNINRLVIAVYKYINHNNMSAFINLTCNGFIEIYHFFNVSRQTLIFETMFYEVNVVSRALKRPQRVKKSTIVKQKSILFYEARNKIMVATGLPKNNYD